MNHQLYLVLSHNLWDSALCIIRNLQDKPKTNGILGYWKLGKEVNSMTALRMQGLATKVFGPKRVKKYSEVEAALEEW